MPKQVKPKLISTDNLPGLFFVLVCLFIFGIVIYDAL